MSYIELLEAWKSGIQMEGFMFIFSHVTEILIHPAIKNVADDVHRTSGDKQSTEINDWINLQG